MAESLGEFEQLVLLAILQLAGGAFAAGVRERIQEVGQRRVSRGALYATLDRLSAKGFITWDVEDGTPERGGIPRRRFQLTEEGLEALRRAYRTLQGLARGLEGLLEEA